MSFGPETDIGHQIAGMLASHGVDPTIALVTNIAPTVCEFVASGTGVPLVHPLMVSDFDRIVVRPFEPQTTLGFLLSHPRASRNARLVDDFIRVARITAGAMLQEALAPHPSRKPSGSRYQRRQL